MKPRSKPQLLSLRSSMINRRPVFLQREISICLSSATIPIIVRKLHPRDWNIFLLIGQRIHHTSHGFIFTGRVFNIDPVLSRKPEMIADGDSDRTSPTVSIGKNGIGGLLCNSRLKPPWMPCRKTGRPVTAGIP